MTMKTYLNPDEAIRLEKAADTLRDRLLIRLLSRLGCRISEALGITVEDVDLEQGTVTILHLKTRLHLTCPARNTRLGRKHTFCPGCGKNVAEAVSKGVEHRRMRTLPMDKETVALLKEFIERGGPVMKDGRVFLFPINRHRGWQVVTECARKAGLPGLVNPETGKTHGVSPHRLRDSFAVHAVKTDDSGDGLRLPQQHLGHSSFNTTARYRKVGGEEHRAWFDKLWGKPKKPSDG